MSVERYFDMEAGVGDNEDAVEDNGHAFDVDSNRRENHMDDISGSCKLYDYCFTLNNPTDSMKRYLHEFAEQTVYLVYQHEIGESGTRHLQGFFRFKSRRSHQAICKEFAKSPARGIYLARRKGTVEQAIEYCTREAKRDKSSGSEIVEFGSKPVGSGSRTDIRSCVNLVKEGKRMRELFEDHPEVMVKYARGIQLARVVFAGRRNFKTEVWWYYGSTGTGKSRAASDECGNEAYWKMGGSKWWDGYEGETNVIIDDYRCDFSTFNFLLRLFDRYPMLLETKGGTVHFCSKKIYVTAPHRPEVMWRSRTDEAIQQLLRRIEVIKLFGEEPVVPEINENVNFNKKY